MVCELWIFNSSVYSKERKNNFIFVFNIFSIRLLVRLHVCKCFWGLGAQYIGYFVPFTSLLIVCALIEKKQARARTLELNSRATSSYKQLKYKKNNNNNDDGNTHDFEPFIFRYCVNAFRQCNLRLRCKTHLFKKNDKQKQNKRIWTNKCAVHSCFDLNETFSV